MLFALYEITLMMVIAALLLLILRYVHSLCVQMYLLNVIQHVIYTYPTV